MGIHQQAKEWAEQGGKQALGREPTLLERQIIQAVAFIESGYGSGWKNEGKGSWNMGAVQTRETDPQKSFAYTDTHPKPDGSSVKYAARFKRYSGPVEGMADVARILFQQMRVTPTSISDVSRQMYEKHYYEGFGATREQRIANHARALTAALEKITNALGEPMPPGGMSRSATPKAPEESGPGLSGLEFLRRLQSVMAREHSFALLADGPKALLAQYQVERGARIDGILGPETLGLLIAELESERA